MSHIEYTFPLQIVSNVSNRFDQVMLTILDLFRKPKVNQLQVPLCVDQDILWLEITVCHTLLLVQELEDQHYFCSVELRSRLVEATRSSEVAKHFSPRTVVEKHVQGVRVLEASNKGCDERVSSD